MTQKELGYVELEWTCPACNTRNPGSARKCTQCGAAQPAEVKFEQAPEEQLVTDEAKVKEAAAAPDIYCAYCGTRNASTAAHCKQCGAALAEGKARQAGEVLGGLRAETAPPVKCPSCGSENPAAARTCAKCGAPLGKTAPPAPQPAARPRGSCLMPLLVIGALILIALLAFVILGSRSQALVGQVSDVHWRRTIAVQVLAPVTRQGWRDELPANVEVGSCQPRVYKTQDEPAPGAREVCGTPYVVDKGTGYGKVVQDCRYEILKDWCDYRTMAWVAAAPIVLEGSDLAPRWPPSNLAQNQRAAGQSENYTIVFTANDRKYEYTPRNEEEFRRFTPGSSWQLEVNGFGSVTGVSPQ